MLPHGSGLHVVQVVGACALGTASNAIPVLFCFVWGLMIQAGEGGVGSRAVNGLAWISKLKCHDDESKAAGCAPFSRQPLRNQGKGLPRGPFLHSRGGRIPPQILCGANSKQLLQMPEPN